MANLPETPDYPAGVYQLETSDPVLGGPGGIANRQAEQLVNRTSWLKAKIDAFIDGTVAVLKATKLATARTLSITGAASGSASFDGSANANIVLTLADSGAVVGTYPKVTINAKGVVTGGAALAAGDIPTSLVLTGNPAAPTATEGVNNALLANMAAVYAATRAYGLGMTDLSDIATDLNLIAATGFYLVTGANQPAGFGAGFLIVTNNGGNCAQRYIAQGTSREFIRTGSIGGVWGVWVEHAKVNSPAFTGEPTAPTPAQFDKTLRLASTEFVKNSGFTFSGYVFPVASRALAAADVGAFLHCAPASAITLTLPLTGPLLAGSVIHVNNLGPGAVTLACAGADTTNTFGTSVVVWPGESITLCSTPGSWNYVGGSAGIYASARFASTLAPVAQQKLPGGWIIKRGVVSGASFPHALTFPEAFPNFCQCLVVQGWSSALGHAGRGQGGATVNLQPGQSGVSGYDWIAIGY